MRDVIRTLVLASVGALDLTEEKLRTILADLVKRGDLTTSDAGELGALRVAALSKVPDEMAGRIRIAVEDALGRANAASQDSLQRLEARVAALEAAGLRQVDDPIAS